MGLKSSSSSSPINITTLFSQTVSDFSRVFLTMNQIVIEREQNFTKIAPSIPFLVDLKLETFELIRDILNRFFPVTSGSMEDTVPNESEECVSVAMINLLTLQIRTAMAHGVDLSCHDFAPVVRSLKDIICHFASSSEALESLVVASQKCLKICWPVLLPTSKERSMLLLQFLNSQTKDENLLFLIELLVSSFLSNGELKLELDSTVNNLWSSVENSEMFANMRSKNEDSDGLDVDLTSLTSGRDHLDVNLNNFEDVVEEKLLDSQIVRLVSQLAETCQNLQLSDLENPPKSHKLLTKYQQLLFTKIISSKASAGSGNEHFYLRKFNKQGMYVKLLFSFISCMISNAVSIVTRAEEKSKCSRSDFFLCAKNLESNSVLVLLKELLYTLTALLRPCQIDVETKCLSNCLSNLIACLNKFNKHSPRFKCEEMSFCLNVFAGPQVSLQPLAELPKIPDYEVHNHNVSGGHWLNLKGLLYNFDNYSSLPTKVAEFVKSCQDGKEDDAPEELLTCLNNYLIGEQVCEKDLIDSYSTSASLSTSPFLILEQLATLLIGYSCGLSFDAQNEAASGSATLEETHSAIVFEYGLISDPFLNSFLTKVSLTPKQKEALRYLETVSLEHEERSQNIAQQILTYRENSQKTSENPDNCSKISQFLNTFWKYCSLTLHCAVFEATHPLEEVSLVLLVLLMKQQNLLSCVNKVQSPADNPKLLDTARSIVKFRTHVIKKHQELNASYKELCNPYFERSKFLLDNLRSAFMQTKLRDLFNGLSQQKIGYNWGKVLRQIEFSKKRFLSDLSFPNLRSSQLKFDVIREDVVNFVMFGPADCRELIAQFQLENMRQLKM